MKSIFMLVAIAVSQFVAAQKTFELKNFNKIAISGSFELSLVKSSENKLVCPEGAPESLKVSSGKGSLALNNNGDAVEAILYYTEPINVFTISGGTEISSKDVIKTDKMSISVSNGVEMQLKAEVESMSISSASGTELSISGTATNLDITVASGSELNAKDLKTSKKCNATLSSGAEAHIYCNGVVNATVAAGAELFIHGKPEKVNETKASGAEIVLMNK